MCLCNRKKPEVQLPALGVEPNSALIDRIHSCKQPTKELSIKKGDLIFSLKELKMPKTSGSKKYDSKENIKVGKLEGDDTFYPKPMSKNEADQDEIKDVSSTTLQYDPYAPLEELEKRECFNCHTLRRNTFLANALSMPNEKERKKKSKPKSPHVLPFIITSFLQVVPFQKKYLSQLFSTTTDRSKVTFNEKVFDITDWEDFASTAEERSDRTQRDSELELVKTQEILPLTSKEAVEGLSDKVHSIMKSATNDSAELTDQNSIPGIFTKAEMSPSLNYEKEIPGNNPELK
ncbi:unnamed protein product [Cercopithifilaria johnstoni]|uniref:Uncharacterized protein n=1 Tax=Cercopithifilaria johnstoni TaxID=2874296 RepID=A0A8J2Q7S1_9BILA|nr:unnamed protein product [Cercopithifilaria johnstoni]